MGKMRQDLEARVENERISRGHHEESAARHEHAPDLFARAIEIGDELERAHGDHGIEKSSFERHALGAGRGERRAHVELAKRLRDVIGFFVDVDAVELAGAARELGQKDAAAITDFEQPAESRVADQAKQQPEARALDRAEQGAIVPVGMVDRPGLDQDFLGEKMKLGDHRRTAELACAPAARQPGVGTTERSQR